MALSGSFNTNKYNNKIGLTLSWTGSQSIANNQTTIKWTLKSSGGSSGEWWYAAPITVVINGTTVLNVTSRFKLYGGGSYKKTGTIVVDHNEDGSKSVSMSVRAAIYSTSVNCTGSKTYTLDKINRYATLTEAPDFNDTDNPVIAYTNYAGDLVDTLQACISLDGTTDNIAYRDIDKLGSGYTFNLTASERNTLLSASTDSNTLNVYFIVKTVIAGNTFYSSLQKTMTIIDADPEIVNPSYADINTGTTYITDDDQLIIQAQSILQFQFGEIKARKRGFLQKITITIDGVTVEVTETSSSAPNVTVDYGIVNSSSNVTAIVKLYDTRGNVTTLEMPITVLSWSAPSAIISCARKNNFYAETIINVDGSVSSLDNKNTMNIRYRYREKGASWSLFKTIQDNTPDSINAPTGLDNKKEYEIQVRITDSITSTTYNLEIPRGVPLIMFDKLRRSVGINCLPSEDDTLEVDGKIKTSGDTDVGGDLSVTGDITGSNITGAAISSTGDADINGSVNAGDVVIDNVSLNPSYSTTERAVGKWIDGSIIYEKTFVIGSVWRLGSNSWVDMTTLTEDIKPLDVIAYLDTSLGSVVTRALMAQYITSTKTLQLLNTRTTDIDIDTYTIRYIKPT